MHAYSTIPGNTELHINKVTYNTVQKRYRIDGRNGIILIRNH